MKNFIDVIDQWPSLQSFATDIGVLYVTAQLMRHRNSIAAKHWKAVVEGARQRKIRGVTLEVLAQLAAEEQEPTPPAKDKPPKRRETHAA